MKIIDKDVTVCFDIDKTLIFWKPEGQEEYEFDLKVDYYGQEISVAPHMEHIQLLKANLARGRNVIVWSGNGFQWVQNTLQAFVTNGLLSKTDGIIVMSKPSMYVDDLECQEWMGNRVYIKPHTNPYGEDK